MKYLALLYIVTLSSVCLSQNLVPNPSFEEYLECPSELGQIDRAMGWQSFRLTPDYFNSCQENSQTGVPVNQFSTDVLAFDGEAFAGFGQVFIPSEYREIIGVELNESLIIGETYYVLFSIRRGIPPASNCWANRIGARFTTSSYEDWPDDVAMPVFNEAHIERLDMVESSETWTQVEGYFVADSAYTFLAIGNQFDVDSLEIACDEAYFNYQAYYFLDAVCVSKNPEDCSIFLSNSDQEHRLPSDVFPNPFNENITITLPDSEILDWARIYTPEGKLIGIYENSKMLVSFQIEIPTTVAKGIYILHGQTRDGKTFYNKLLKN